MDNGDAIDVVTAIRIKNNDLWMKILRIALKHSPEETRVVINKISENDKEITKWLKKL